MPPLKRYKRIDIDSKTLTWLEDRFPNVAIAYVVGELLEGLQTLGERHPSWTLDDLLESMKP